MAISFFLAFFDQGIHFFFEHLQGFSHDGVEGGHSGSTVCRRTYRAELKLVTGKGKRRGTVTVGVIQHQFRNVAVQIQFQDSFVLLIKLVVYAGLNFLQYFKQVFTYENGDDSGGRFVSTQTEVVAGRSNGSTHQVCIVMHGFDGVHKEGQEHEVGLGCFTRGQQVHTGIGGHAPVIVLT
jgi:hypothetical protein